MWVDEDEGCSLKLSFLVALGGDASTSPPFLAVVFSVGSDHESFPRPIVPLFLVVGLYVQTSKTSGLPTRSAKA